MDDQVRDYENQKETPTSDRKAYAKLEQYATMDPTDRTPAMMRTINKTIKNLGQQYGIKDIRYITRNMNENQIQEVIYKTQQKINSVQTVASKIRNNMQKHQLRKEVNKRVEETAAKKAAAAAAKADATTAATRAAGLIIANQKKKQQQPQQQPQEEQEEG